MVGADWAEAVARRRKGADPGLGSVLSRKKQIEQAEEFQHLLSFDMSQVFSRLGTSHLYVGIHKRDLRKKQFEKAALVYQDS